MVARESNRNETKHFSVVFATNQPRSELQAVSSVDLARS